MAKDPVCGIEVEKSEAAAISNYKGTTYYFCAPGCKKAFDWDSEKYVLSQNGLKNKEATINIRVNGLPSLHLSEKLGI
jgi:Cu+-exporting ATPase